MADSGNHCIRRITPDGVVSTLAGSGTRGFKDGRGSAAQVNDPLGVAVDADGNVLVADSGNHCIRRITPDGMVSTLAGSGSSGFKDGRGTEAQFYSPWDVTVDADGNVIVAERNNLRIRRITPDGMVSTLAGSGTEGFQDGRSAEAEFYSPSGVAVDGDGNVLVAEFDGHCIRRITPDGMVSTLAGASGSRGFKDGRGTEAQFTSPWGVAVDAQGRVYVGDCGGDRIRRLSSYS